jgi:hypothetical protein
MDELKLWEDASNALRRLFEAVDNKKDHAEIVIKCSRRTGYALRSSFLKAWYKDSHFMPPKSTDPTPDIAVNGLVFRIEGYDA